MEVKEWKRAGARFGGRDARAPLTALFLWRLSVFGVLLVARATEVKPAGVFRGLRFEQFFDVRDGGARGLHPCGDELFAALHFVPAEVADLRAYANVGELTLILDRRALHDDD